MGNDLSVSSVVDGLYKLEPEERSKALDRLCEQENDEIRGYVQSKSERNQEISGGSLRPAPKQQDSGVIRIKESVPDDKKFTDKEYSLWKQDVSVFWGPSSSTFIPNDPSCTPIRFIYNATVGLGSKTHADCLRKRYIALFWFDYFKIIYPGEESGFDSDYVRLGCRILGPETTDTDGIGSVLRKLVHAGKRYNMLTTKFGDSILLTLPSCIGKTTLELKMPLDDKFETWIGPIVGSVWEEQAKETCIRVLGQDIRSYLLRITYEKEADCQPSRADSLLRPSKKRKTCHMETAAETVSAVSPNTADSPTLPNTPLALPQVYSIENYCNLSTSLNPADSCHVAALVSTTGDSTSAVPGVQPNLDNQSQGIEGNSRNTQHVAPNQDTFEGDENLSPLVRLESQEFGLGVGSSDVFMPSDFSSWDCDADTFQPVHFQADQEENIFLPVPFDPSEKVNGI